LGPDYLTSLVNLRVWTAGSRRAINRQHLAIRGLDNRSDGRRDGPSGDQRGAAMY
jgi:hypothetical protein